MNCEHCGFKFNTIALKANQDTQTVCPACGKLTLVHYTFMDSLKDVHGWMVRDPKYVSGRNLLKIICFLLLGIIILISVLHLLK